MTDDRDHDPGAGRDDSDTDADASTGDLIDARFDVETEGEAESADADRAPTGLDEATFTMAPQVGEAVPPELREALPHADLGDFELADPTDPGFTLSDIVEEEPEVPPSAPAVELPVPPPSEQPPAEVFDFPTPQSAAPSDSPRQADAADPDDVWDNFTDGDYVASSTQEYQGLAAELEQARYEEHELSAVSATIPGLDTGVVGLADVTGEADAADVAEAPSSLTDLGLRVATGLGLLGLFFLSLLASLALGALALTVFAVAAFELYAVLMRTRHQPMSLLGLGGVIGCLVGAWVWGVIAIPMAVVISLIAVALYFGVSPPRDDTLRDASLTVLGVAWIGGMGAFAMPIIRSDDFVWLIGAVVVLVAAMDVGQFFTGRAFGRRPLAPVVSPKKTVEGLVGGAILTLAVGFGFSFFGPFTRMSALLLAGCAVVFGPIGDLSVSSIKRRIGVKDMGTLLPGHGGILDRIDALLFVIPAAWVVLRATGLIT